MDEASKKAVFLKTICILSVLIFGVRLHGMESYRIEAEDLKASPGWRIGVGAPHSMGRVMVAMKKNSVLTGDYHLDKPGTYHVWVKTLSYGEKWRVGRLFVNQQEAGTFGDDELPPGRKRGDWYWSRLKSLQLPAGKTSIRIESPRGYTRMDCLILTDSEQFAPPESRQETENIKRMPADAPEKLLLQLPPTRGRGPDILLLHGGRPWVGRDTRAFLVKSGSRVMLLDSTYLDGMGGASIKNFLTDLVEPKAKDGITPAMEQLDRFQAVVITAIPPELQQKILTPYRIGKLETNVRNGGSLILNINAPAALGDLLPVTLGPWKRNQPEYRIRRPDAPGFSCLPPEWHNLADFREMTPRDGTQVLLSITNAQNRQAGIFAAMKRHGRGNVLIFNDDWTRKTGMRQLFTWAYGKALFTALIARAGNLDLAPEKTLYALTPPPSPKHHGRLSLAVEQPAMHFSADRGAAVLRKTEAGHMVSLPNGIRMAVSPQGLLNVFFPNSDLPYLTGMQPPALTFSGKLLEVDMDTAEAINKDVPKKTLSGKWRFEGSSIDGQGRAVLSYANVDGTRLDWSFRSGSLKLNGRTFAAFADQATIVKSDHMIESFRFKSRFATEKTTARHYTRRMSCYSPPRGYVELDLSGARKADTWTWNLRGSGQPFTWIVSPAGVYADFVLQPDACCSARIRISQGETEISDELTLVAGYRKAPVAMAEFWHAFSPGDERGNNDWMAMYQFIRQDLRRRLGLKSFAPVPTATWQNVCTRHEIDLTLATAEKLGFRRIALPWCPSPIEHIDSDDAKKAFQKVRAHHMIPFPWSAGDYCHGDSEEIFRNHKDWFVRKMDGSIYAYMNMHPVLDLNNPDFQKWYFGKMDRAIRNGMGAIYFDMYGAAWGNINYGLRDTRPCCIGACKIFKFFSDRNVMVDIEGQNPLVIDNYWFRQSKYQPFHGKEFAMLAASPSSGNAGDDLALDYFRTSMYGAFMYVNVDGYAQNFERTVGELKKVERIGRLNPRINAAQALVGFPFIRETPFGTLWISSQGGALFFYDAVDELQLELPEGWTAENAVGNRLRNVANDTIVLLRPAGK